MNYSYVMGMGNEISELKNTGFIIEPHGRNYMVSFSKESSEIFKYFILGGYI